ncbi:MAG: DUF6069 family protein [Bacteroidota bacterium]
MKRIEPNKFLPNVLYACLSGGIVNTLLFFIGTGTGVIPETVAISPDGKALALPPVVLASVVPVLVAALLFYLMSLFMASHRRWFLVIAVVVLLLSFITPFGIENVPFGMALLLNSMHLVVAASVLYFFTRTKEKASL